MRVAPSKQGPARALRSAARAHRGGVSTKVTRGSLGTGNSDTDLNFAGAAGGGEVGDCAGG